jgi:flagellar biosynthesis/type III secretory pathway protein FliH
MTSSPDAFVPFTLASWESVVPAHVVAALADADAAFADGEAGAAGVATAWCPPEITGVATPGATGETTRSPEAEAYALGHADGQRQGDARARSELRPVLQALAALAERLELSRDRFERDRERNLRGLALAVAHRLIVREVTAHPDLVQGLIAQALEMMPPDAPLDVRLHPADLQAIRADVDAMSGAGRAIPLHWVADPALERGSFFVESPARLIDGRTDTALRTLFERLDHE